MQFLVKKGIVMTPHADYCLPGITRATVRIYIFHVKKHVTIHICQLEFILYLEA